MTSEEQKEVNETLSGVECERNIVKERRGMDDWQKVDNAKIGCFFVFVLVLMALATIFIATTVMDKCASGLVLNMIGVLIVFVFGFPQPDYDNGCCLGLESATVIDDKGHTVGDFEKRNRKNKKWHKAWAILGLIYLFVGFGFQLYYQLAQTIK